MADGNAQAKLMSADHRLEQFLTELTHLSRRGGIAVNGGAELVLMDHEDEALSYKADSESRLSLS
jgi:hypothetical protein